MVTILKGHFRCCSIFLKLNLATSVIWQNQFAVMFHIQFHCIIII